MAELAADARQQTRGTHAQTTRGVGGGTLWGDETGHREESRGSCTGKGSREEAVHYMHGEAPGHCICGLLSSLLLSGLQRQGDQLPPL